MNLSKGRLGAVVSATALIVAGLGGASPAQASHDCASRAEFNMVRKGMTKAHVHDRFDINGYFADGFAGGFTRGYRYCRPEVVRKVFVSYSPRGGAYRVVEKQMGRS